MTKWAIRIVYLSVPADVHADGSEIFLFQAFRQGAGFV